MEEDSKKTEVKQCTIPSVMPRFLGIATELSPMAIRHLCVDDIDALEQYLPCEAFASDEIANVDDSYLVKFEDMTQREEYVHIDMLIINDR